MKNSGDWIFFQLPESNGKTAPNKACTRQVGFCAIFEYFPRLSRIHISKRIHTRPLAGNANRWALRLKQIIYFFIER
jgi:hypothetical protein